MNNECEQALQSIRVPTDYTDSNKMYDFYINFI